MDGKEWVSTKGRANAQEVQKYGKERKEMKEKPTAEHLHAHSSGSEALHVSIMISLPTFFQVYERSAENER